MAMNNISTFNKTKKATPGELLHMYRSRTQLTQAELAVMLGLKSFRMLQYWEGGYSLPKAEKLKKEQQQPHYDPSKIAALLDKRDDQRHAAAGEQLSPTPGIGKSTGNAAVLSQSEIDALRKRLQECWNPPVGAVNAGNLKVIMRVLFRPDGSVATVPQLVAGPPSAYGPAMAESAKRAILTCQPYKMLRPENYEHWKDLEIDFDPKEMFGL